MSGKNMKEKDSARHEIAELARNRLGRRQVRGAVESRRRARRPARSALGRGAVAMNGHAERGNLMDLALDRLGRAIDALTEADSEAALNGLRPAADDLLACDLIGAGFASVVDAVWIALRVHDASWTAAQMSAVAEAFRAVRAHPEMDRECGRRIVAGIERSGLAVRTTDYRRLA